MIYHGRRWPPEMKTTMKPHVYILLNTAVT
jgi:hypothetical protein